MPFITDHGLRIHYREERPPRRIAAAVGRVPRALVFLPGDTMSSAGLAGELRYFGHRYRTLALDPPGTGRSERLPAWPEDWWRVTAVAAATLIERLGSTPAVVVGSSDGGLAALLLALERPDLVKGVVADSCPPTLRASELRTAAAARRRVLAASGEGPPDDPHNGRSAGSWRLRIRRWPRVWSWQRAHGSDWRDVIAADADLRERVARGGDYDPCGGRLTALRCPVLFSGSLDDDVIPDLGVRLEEAAEALPDARVFLWPEGGHPLMWTAPAAFRRAVDDFLTDIATAGSVDAESADADI